MTPASLAAVGYRRVSPDSARAGDIVVRGGHAGVFLGYNDAYAGLGVWGYANNGLPAKPDRANLDGDTGWYNFATLTDTKGNTYAPEFFRALVVTACP